MPEIHKTLASRHHVKCLFTKESWNGRIKACRGIGASLSEEAIMQFEKEHKMLLDEIAPTEFTVLHYAAIAVMKALPCVG